MTIYCLFWQTLLLKIKASFFSYSGSLFSSTLLCIAYIIGEQTLKTQIMYNSFLKQLKDKMQKDIKTMQKTFIKSFRMIRTLIMFLMGSVKYKDTILLIKTQETTSLLITLEMPWWLTYFLEQFSHTCLAQEHSKTIMRKYTKQFSSTAMLLR